MGRLRWFVVTCVATLVASILVGPLGQDDAAADSVTSAHAHVGAEACNEKIDDCQEKIFDKDFTSSSNVTKSATKDSASAKGKESANIAMSDGKVSLINASASGSAQVPIGANKEYDASGDGRVRISVTFGTAVTLVATGSAHAKAKSGQPGECSSGFVGVDSTTLAVATDPTCSGDSGDHPDATVSTTMTLNAGSHLFEVSANGYASFANSPNIPQPSSSASATASFSFECGYSVTTDFTLTHDLTCPGDGIVIPSAPDTDPDITIDLGGHTLSGPSGSTGIANQGRDGVTIKNGTISDYDTGISLSPGTDRNVVKNLKVENNAVHGIALSTGTNNQIKNNTITGNGVGIELTNVVSNLVSGNVVNSNDSGISLASSDDNTITQNHVESSTFGDGLALNHSDDNTIRGNVSLLNNSDGLEIDASTGNTVADNTLNQNESDGLLISLGGSNQVTQNVLHDNHNSGMDLSGTNSNIFTANAANANHGVGVLLVSSGTNTFTGDKANHNLAGGFILVSGSAGNTLGGVHANHNSLDGFKVTGSDGNFVRNGTFNANESNGILVESDANTTEVSGDTADDNGSFGIDSQNASTFRVAKNHTSGNTGGNCQTVGASNVCS